METSEQIPRRFPLVARGADETETFVAVIRRLSRAQSVKEIMAVAAPAARQLLAADGITFVLRDGNRCHYADEDAISPLWKGKRFPMQECISGWCMMHRRATAIPDIYQDRRIPEDAYRPTFVRSLAMAPVNKDAPVGAMGAYWAERRQVASNELDLLQAMADAASLAISNAELRSKDGAADHLRRDNAHRIKNIFTMALALVNQTSGGNVEEYKKALTVRLSALERAHAVMFEAETGTVNLPNMLNQLLAPYTSGDQLCLQCETDQVLLSAQEATDLALILNELASNAIKYGALSIPEGQVTVSCRAEARGLRLSWRERGGPKVEPPSRAGLGTKLIGAIAIHDLGGEADIRYAPSGLECDVMLPLGKG